MKVGKLLGATLIVAGAYQKARRGAPDRALRRRSRPARLSAPPRSTAGHRLLQPAGPGDRRSCCKLGGHGAEQVSGSPARAPSQAEEPQADRAVRRRRSREGRSKKKLEILRLALNEDPAFIYASRDLDALEKRLRQYARTCSIEAATWASRRCCEIRREEKDPMQRYNAYLSCRGNSMVQRRWRTLHRRVARGLANPPDAAVSNMTPAEQRPEIASNPGYDQFFTKEEEPAARRREVSAEVSVVDDHRDHEDVDGADASTPSTAVEMARRPPSRRSPSCRRPTAPIRARPA